MKTLKAARGLLAIDSDYLGIALIHTRHRDVEASGSNRQSYLTARQINEKIKQNET